MQKPPHWTPCLSTSVQAVRNITARVVLCNMSITSLVNINIVFAMVCKTLYDLAFHSFPDLISSYYPPHTHTPLQSRNYFSDIPIMLHPRAFAPALPLPMNALLSADIPKADTITSFKFQFKGHLLREAFPYDLTKYCHLVLHLPLLRVCSITFLLIIHNPLTSFTYLLCLSF